MFDDLFLDSLLDPGGWRAPRERRMDWGRTCRDETFGDLTVAFSRLACQHPACVDLAWLVPARRLPGLDLLDAMHVWTSGGCVDLAWLRLACRLSLTWHPWLEFLDVTFSWMAWLASLGLAYLIGVNWFDLIWSSAVCTFSVMRIHISSRIGDNCWRNRVGCFLRPWWSKWSTRHVSRECETE